MDEKESSSFTEDDDFFYDNEFAGKILKEVEDARSGRTETYSLDEVRAHCGLTDKEGSSNASNSRSD